MICCFSTCDLFYAVIWTRNMDVLNGKWTALMHCSYNQWPCATIYNSASHSPIHSHTEGGVNHARRQLACRSFSGVNPVTHAALQGSCVTCLLKMYRFIHFFYYMMITSLMYFLLFTRLCNTIIVFL